MSRRLLTIRVYDLGEFDEKMLKKALKVIGDEDKLVVMVAAWKTLINLVGNADGQSLRVS